MKFLALFGLFSACLGLPAVVSDAIMSLKVQEKAIESASQALIDEAHKQFYGATKSVESAVSAEEVAKNRLIAAETKLAKQENTIGCFLPFCRMTKEKVEELRLRADGATQHSLRAKQLLNDAIEQDRAARDMKNLNFLKQIVDPIDQQAPGTSTSSAIMSDRLREKSFDAAQNTAQKQAKKETASSEKLFEEAVNAEGRTKKRVAEKFREFIQAQSDKAKAALERAQAASKVAAQAAEQAQNEWNMAANQLRATEDPENKPFWRQMFPH